MFPEWIQVPATALGVLIAVRFALVADPSATKFWARVTRIGAGCWGLSSAIRLIEAWGWWALPVIGLMIGTGVAWVRRLPPPAVPEAAAA